MKLNQNIVIDSLPYMVHISDDPWKEIEHFIRPYQEAGGVFILTDDNTRNHCLPLLTGHVPMPGNQPVYSILPGEISKDVLNLDRIWKWLMDAGAGQNSLLVNLGGGVVSDLGGFAASTYNRGISYINIPTTLIAQADAAIGGKTGINVAGIKNQAGTFYDPAAVFIIPVLLKTLPEKEYFSGFAEIIKCAALSGKKSWDLLNNNDLLQEEKIFMLIFETASFKCRIVAEDPSDRSTRRILNFGHTIGHALESLSARNGEANLLHGQAVASGMICEAWLSHRLAGLPESEMKEIVSVIKSYFDLRPAEPREFDELVRLVDFDKKKSGKRVVFSLLRNIGKHSTGIIVNNSDLIKSFEFYNEIIQQR